MAMQEKEMVCDVLSMTKASMSDYTNSIGGCSNQSLRNALTQLRAEAEQFQNQLAQIATQKGYYPTSQPATQQDKQQLKSQLTQG
ncbi:MAG: spore coat protein [Maledivibacter sp.]|jgi:spore coat protein CotF|nr:spore coat protein [Maledivibacter sp.]